MLITGVDIRKMDVTTVDLRQIDNVSTARREHIMRFRREEDRRRTLAATLLLDELLRDHADISERSVTYIIGKHGKPRVEGLDSLHFNLSHSGRWAVAAMASTAVGVDVQEVAEFKPEAARLVMPLIEVERIASFGDEERDREFTRCWTRLEACCKLTGEGLSTHTPEKEFEGIDIYDEWLDERHHLSVAVRRL